MYAQFRQQPGKSFAAVFEPFLSAHAAAVPAEDDQVRRSAGGSFTGEPFELVRQLRAVGPAAEAVRHAGTGEADDFKSGIESRLPPLGGHELDPVVPHRPNLTEPRFGSSLRRAETPVGEAESKRIHFIFSAAGWIVHTET